MTESKQIGPYTIEGLLGKGAMARVWRAWDTSLARHVALKEPVFDSRYSEVVLDEMARRFTREAKVGARLSGHPGIVTVYAADVYDGRPALVMELVDGVTLADILEGGPLDVPTTLDVLDQLLDAVGYAHSLGVVHRDLKPDNIFVDKTGRVKVADFGVAGVNDSSYSQATMVNVVLGTPGYMSPEQAVGDFADARSDLFSIGVIAYEMLTGRNPFGVSEGADSAQLLYNIAHGPVPSFPRELSPLLPPGLEAAILAALSKLPQDRPRDTASFKAMLHGSAVGAAESAAHASSTGSAPSGKTGTLMMPLSAHVGPGARLRTGWPQRWVPPAITIAAVCAILLFSVIAVGPVTSAGTQSTAQTHGSESPSSSASHSSSSSASSTASGSSSSSPSDPSSSQVLLTESEGGLDEATPAEPGLLDGEVEAQYSAAEEPVAETAYVGSAGADDAAPEGSFWGVFIDAFYDAESARACADEANASGLPATVYELSDENGIYYVVNAGEYPTRSEAEYAVSQAVSLGFANAYTGTATHL